MSVRATFRKFIANGHAVTDYVAVALRDHPVKALLNIGSAIIDVSKNHFSLAYNPVIIGIEIPSEVKDYSKDLELVFKTEGSGVPLCALQLRIVKEANLHLSEGSCLILCEVTGSALFQLDWFRRSVILVTRFIANRRAKKFFGSLPFNLHRNYAALFSFPRKVVLLAVKGDYFRKTFPIDLHGEVSGDHVLLGLRHTNSAVSALKEGAKVAMASVPAEHQKTIYSLGKFRSEKDFASPSFLITTEYYAIEIPGFILDYKELQIVGHEDIGSQCLFYAKIVHRSPITDQGSLHHVHMIEYLNDFSPRTHD